jgi:hypothetical protein
MIKPSEGVSMQARMEPYGESVNATVFTAFALSNSLEKIQIQVSQASGIDVLLDGELLSFPTTRDVTFHTDSASITVKYVSSLPHVTVAFSAGMSFTFTSSEGSLSVVSSASDFFAGKLRGLLGFFDKDPSNDLMAPDGTFVPSTSSLQDIHTNFGLMWMISPEESLFEYDEGESYFTYCMPDFIPTFEVPNIEELPEDVVLTCGSSTACLFDYVATGSITLANQTRNNEVTFEKRVEVAAIVVQMCSPPLTPENGYFEAANFLVGSTLKFFCNEGYERVGGSSMDCVQEIGSEPDWTGTPATCKAIPKPPSGSSSITLNSILSISCIFAGKYFQ